MLDSAHRYLIVEWFRSRYYIGIQSDSIEDFKYYCMYERKNHPGKKGIGKGPIPIAKIEEINRELYPFWFSEDN